MKQELQTFFNTTTDSKSKCEGENQLDVTVSVIFYVLQWLLLFPILYVNILVLRMLKREHLTVSLELKVGSICNIIVSIASIAHHGILKFAYPASVCVGVWYCHVSSVFMTLDSFRHLLQSLILTLYRYVFIIHREKLTTKKQETYVIWAIFVVKWTVLMVFVAKYIIFNQGEFFGVWINICHGNLIKQPLGEVNTTTLGWFLEILEMGHCTTNDGVLVTNYGTAEGGLAYFLSVFCFIIDLLFNLTCLNLLEGFLYYRIAIYMKS